MILVHGPDQPVIRFDTASLPTLPTSTDRPLLSASPTRSARVIRETRQDRRRPLGIRAVGGLMAFRGSFPGRAPEGVPGFSGPGPVSRLPDASSWPSFLTLEVKGRAYGLTVGDDSFTLEKPDGTLHEVTRGDHPTCTCGDFVNRHAGLSTGGCVHIRTLRSVNLLPPFPMPRPQARALDACDSMDAARFFGMA